ncbi:PPK2 family polyphosphate kinase [Flectobacillus roseus]
MAKPEMKDFSFDGNGHFSIKKLPTKIEDLYVDEADYLAQLSELHKKIDKLQSRMYAHGRYGMVIIFQALDAAGKDGTIKAVFSGINPAGIVVHSFKRPSAEELDHDFMWRSMLKMPQRGQLAIHNRSYYEEVLVVKVHPSILLEGQRLPEEQTKNLEKVWKERYDSIKHYEKHLHQNGFEVVKFFLNVSKKEQSKRLIERIEDPDKNWKFEEQDVKERAFWKEYHEAYQELVDQTATEHSPWYVIPADDKKNMRLMVAQVIHDRLSKLKMEYPASSPERHEFLQSLIATIKKQEAED